MAPTYEKVATVFAKESNCIVAKVDATAETKAAQKYKVTGYPTIKFFSKTDKSGVEYSGGRSEQDFINFLNENCGTHRVPGGGLGEKVVNSLKIQC